MGLIHTGIHLTEEELIEVNMCKFNPTASMFGPRKTKEPYEVLQDIAERYGLPKIADMYGMTVENEIVCRDLKENRGQLEDWLKKK